MNIIKTITILLYSAMAGSFASASPSPSRYHQLAQRAQAAASPDNTVLVESAEKYWCVFSPLHFPPNLFLNERTIYISIIVPRSVLKKSKPSGRSNLFW